VKIIRFLALLIALSVSHHSFAQSSTQISLQSAMHSNTKRMQACTTCHGAGSIATVGRTANEVYFPRIAGKPAQYLYNQLLNFRDGRRHYGLMVGLVEHQSDAALMEMAQYFSSLQLPYPEPQAPPAGTTQAAMQRGQQLALRGDPALGIAACASCHGAGLQGAGSAIPGLLGLPRDYMAGQLGAWQTGMRKAQAPDCMAQIARKLSAEDVSAAVTWLAAQPVQISAGAPISSLQMPMPCGGVK
jgi:cytochrome c553